MLHKTKNNMAKLKVINSVKSIFLVIPVLFLFSCRPNPASQWRGPERNGIFHETGLLQEWPENGPELLWRYDSLMMGHSSPVVTDDAIYITGMPDSTSGYLFCLSHRGELLWKELYGEEYKTSYTGSRATPTIAGNLLYLESGFGEVICFDLKTRNKSWSFQMKENFGVDPVNYGNAESLLIHKNKLFCTPGGKDQSIVGFMIERAAFPIMHLDLPVLGIDR